MSLSCFRGEFAAASLKRTAQVGTAQVGTGFRGEFAAASLKHRVERALQRERVRFRGEFAAASLKPTIAGIITRLSPPFPRRVRRGLIEAVHSGE